MTWLAQLRRGVSICPAGLVDQKDSVAGRVAGTAAAISARCRFIASVLQAGRIELSPLPRSALHTERVGGGGTLVTRCASAGAAFRPATGNLVLLADTSFVGEPDFYRVAIERLCAPISSRRPAKLF